MNKTDKMQVSKNNATTSDTVKCHLDHQICKGESDQKMGMVGALIRVMRKGLLEVTSEQRPRKKGGREGRRRADHILMLQLVTIIFSEIKEGEGLTHPINKYHVWKK